MPEKMPIAPPDKDATSKRTADETTEAKAQGASHEAGKVPASTTAAWRPIINEPVVVRRESRRNSIKRITTNGTIAAAAMVFGAILAVVVALAGGVTGLYFGYYADLPPGPVVVLTQALVFGAAQLFAPRRGVVPRALAGARARRSGMMAV